MMEWAKWYRFFPNIELSNLKGATYVKQKQKEQSYRIWWWARLPKVEKINYLLTILQSIYSYPLLTIMNFTGYSFWDWLRNFLHKFTWIVCQFISWTNWVNSGKFMDSCWISCQVMAYMKKVYDNLIIINLYYSVYLEICINYSNFNSTMLFWIVFNSCDKWSISWIN